MPIIADASARVANAPEQKPAPPILPQMATLPCATTGETKKPAQLGRPTTTETPKITPRHAEQWQPSATPNTSERAAQAFTFGASTAKARQHSAQNPQPKPLKLS